jgi:DNA-binding transcriptional LysR family regulator
MEFTLFQLEILNAVVVAGSITKAAKRLKVSQPTISHQIAKFEKILDTQLLHREKKGTVSLTYAGEFWHKTALEILLIKSKALEEHSRIYTKSRLIRLGIVPNFRGSFILEVAKIMQQNSDHLKFELIYDAKSESLVEKLKMHQLDFAIVDQTAIENEAKYFHLTHLFEDKFAWAVPISVSNKLIMKTLLGTNNFSTNVVSLQKHVEVQLPSIVKGKCENWFLNNLPNSKAAFSAPTWTAAIELVAGGLATSHVALSLLPYQQENVLNAIKLFEMKDIKTSMVLATQKHLMTQKAYRQRHNELVSFCRTEHAVAIENIKLNPLPFIE